MNNIEQSIYDEVERHDGIRWSALKRIIVDEKKIASDRIFRETVNRMTINKILVRKEITKQHVEYFTQANIRDKNSIKFILSLISSGIQIDISRFKEKQKRLKIYEKAKCVQLIFNLINQIEFILTLDDTMYTKEINQYKKQNREAFESLKELIEKNKKPEQIWNLALSEWNEDISNQMNRLHEILKK